MNADRFLVMLPGPTNVPDRVLRAMSRPVTVSYTHLTLPTTERV